MIFFKISLDISTGYFFALFIAVNKVNSKHLQISSSVINCQGIILIFMEFQEPLKLLKFQPLSRNTTTYTKPAIN